MNHDIFEDIDEQNHESIRKQYHTVVMPLYQGFIDEENQLVCYTDHQIFERFHRYKLKRGFTKDQALNLKLLRELETGDFVVHIDHGVGRFSGLEKLEVNGKILF